MIECNLPVFCSEDPRVSIGRFTYGNPRLMLWSENERIEIGAFCSIAEGVTLFGGGEHNISWVTTYPLRIALAHQLARKDGHPATKGLTKIENDVWIGYGATILSGVTVGSGAVIGANSVVAKDVPPYAIAVGNPAKISRLRFDQNTIDKLLAIAWWDWPLEVIENAQSLLCGADMDKFLEMAYKRKKIIASRIEGKDLMNEAD